MATALPASEFISVGEYLRTSYSPDCEYVDGEVRERNLGEFDHAMLQGFLVFLFTSHRAEWDVVVLPEQRVQVSATRFRVPDVCVLRRGAPREQIIVTPPLICIEILSPEDRLAGMREKLSDYLAMGVENVWLVDPALRVAYLGTMAGFEEVHSGELVVADTPIRIGLPELFAELDDAR